MSSWNELVEKRILSVLGMNSTGANLAANLSNEQKSRLAIGHINNTELSPWNIPSIITHGGGLYSTADDMLKFLSVNMGLIKTKLNNAMQESHLIRHYNGFLVPQGPPTDLKLADNNNGGEGFYAGLGWMINTNYGREIIWYNGITPDGYNSLIAFNPTTLKGIVLFATDVQHILNAASIPIIASVDVYHKHVLAYLIWQYLNN
jgi:serine-type D-Ala-D-Ala carboxypeptidase/endopeptidase